MIGLLARETQMESHVVRDAFRLCIHCKVIKRRAAQRSFVLLMNDTRHRHVSQNATETIKLL